MGGTDLVLLPEEEELARLKERLAQLEDELADSELDLATRRRELLDFQTRYLAMVGVRMAELDKLEAQIAAILAEREATAEADVAAEQAYARARASAEAIGDDADALAEAAVETAREAPPELRTLFRQVARAVHPDLAGDEEDRKLREDLMRRANAAYENRDVESLQAILDDWKSHPQAVKGEGTGAELVRVIRAIRKVEERLAAISQEFAAVGTEHLTALHDQVQAARDEGRDLLQEMAEELDSRIEVARRRLAVLRT